jgi:hypothetical protein
MRQPLVLPLVTAFIYPLPEKLPPPPVGWDPPEVVVLVGVELPDLGRYLMPDVAQLELDPTGLVGTKVPL